MRLPASLRCWLIAGLVALSLPALARSQDLQIELGISPGCGERLPAPGHLEVRIGMEEPFQASLLRWDSLRIFDRGREITAGFLDRVIAASAVRFERDGLEILLRDPRPLRCGPHAFDVRLTNLLGYEHRQRTDCEILPALPRIARPEGPVAPAGIDQAPPTLVLEPHHFGFVASGTPDLVVRYSDDIEGIDPATLVFQLDGADLLGVAQVGAARALYRVPAGAPLANGRHVLYAYLEDLAGHAASASATFVVFDRSSKHPWHFAPTGQPHPLAHTHHQFQWYGGGSSSAYFHHGIDVREPSGTPVYACAGGIVENMGWYGQQPYYYEIAIRDRDGFLWEYHHVDQPTIPAAIYTAYQSHAPLAGGTHLGNVVYWPTRAYGQRFHHIHLNVKDIDGRYHNPLHFILDLRDSTAPTCAGIWVLPNRGSQAFGGNPPVVSGDVDVVARFEDLIAPEPYQLTLYRTEIEIRELSGRAVHHVPPTLLWQFDNLPGGTSTHAGVWDIYKESFQWGSQTFSTRGDYNNRRFYYTLTNTLGGRLDDAASFWDTDGLHPVSGIRLFPNGTYRIFARAWDIKGNTVERTLDVVVSN